MSNDGMYGGPKVRRERTRAPYRGVPDVSSAQMRLGQDLKQGGAMFEDLLEDFNKELGDDRVLDRAVRANETIRKLRTGYLTREGTDVDGSVEDASDEIDDVIEATVSQPGLAQRDEKNLRSLLFRYQRGTLDMIANHVRNETTKASIANKVILKRDNLEFVESDPLNPKAETDALKVILPTILKDSEEGEANPVLALEIMNAKSEVREARIRGLLNMNTPRSLEMAKDLLDLEQARDPDGEGPAKGGGVLTAIAEQRLRSHLAQRQRAASGVELANQASEISTRLWDSDLPFDEKLDWANTNIADERVQKRVLSKLHQLDHERHQKLKWAIVDQKLEYTQAFEKAPDADAVPSGSPFLSATDEGKLRAYAVRRAKGTPIETDPKVRGEIHSELDSNIERFKARNLLIDYGQRLSTEERHYYEGIQREMRGGKGTVKVERVRSYTKQVDLRAKQIGIDTTPDGPAAVKAYEEFSDYVYQEVHKRGFTPDTVPEEDLDDILTLATAEGQHGAGPWPWDTGAKVYQLKPGTKEYDTFYIDDIPEETVSEIEAELKKEKIPYPTKAQISRRYLTRVRAGTEELP